MISGHLAAALEWGVPHVAFAAARGSTNDVASAIACIETALAASDHKARRCAVSAMWALGREHLRLEFLRRALKDPDHAVQQDACALAGEFSVVELREDLEQLLSQGFVLIRPHAAVSLGTVGDAEHSVPVLVKALADDHAPLRWNSLYAIAKLRPPVETGTSAGVSQLADRSRNVRAAALFLIASYGTEAKIVEESIRPLLKDSEENVRLAAKASLLEIGSGIVEEPAPPPAPVHAVAGTPRPRRAPRRPKS